MKELVSKEFLFLLVALITAIPAGIIFLALLKLQPESTGIISPHESVLEMDLLIIGGIIGFAGAYLMRLIVWAIKNIVLNK